MLKKFRFHAAGAALAVLGSTVSLLACAQALHYPVSKKTDHTDTYFGTVVADPYHWLEDGNSPDTKAWIAAQNRLTFGYLDRIPYRAAVFKRIQKLVDYAKYSAPFRKNGKVYFYKNDGLQNQSVLYVQDGDHGTPQVLLDPNTFSPDGTIRLTSFDLSRNGRYAVYGRTAIPGSDWNDLYVMDMRTHTTLPEVIHWVKFSSGAWHGDGFYYSRFPQPEQGHELTAANRNQKVYFHRVGTPVGTDRLVYEDPRHPTYFVDVGTTEDERYAVLTVQDPSKRGNSLFVRDDNLGEQAFKPIVKDITENSYGVVDNEGERLLIVTDHDAPNQKVMLYDPSRPDEKNWKTVLPEQPDLLESVTTGGGKLFATYLKDVAAHAYVYDMNGKLEREVALPGPGTVGGLGGLKEDKDVFYVFQAMNYPPTIFRYDIASGQSSIYHTAEIQGFDPSRYESRQVFFHSKDGTRVPMFLVYKKGLQLDGRNPTILYGYGGFDITLNPTFSPARIAWLEQGGVYAMANLRGGGEYGEKWHEAGMRLHKQDVFDDCIAAAQYLIAQKYTSPDRLALLGGSNGGLLVGAVINQRPDLFQVAVPEVGVMDMLRFQKFSAGAAWVSDYGSSDDETQFRYLLKYSPLHNIQSGVRYPATLVITSDHDDRVVPAHSFKYTATRQEKSDGSTPVLIRIETNSGHGSSNLSKALQETADVYAFIWNTMGVVPHY
jgi:prolyl oligopeptidase